MIKVAKTKENHQKMAKLRHSLLFATTLLAFFLIIFSSHSYAGVTVETDLQKSFNQIKARSDKFKFNTVEVKELDNAQQDYAALDLKLDECISNKSSQLEGLKKDMKLLGKSQATEESDVKKKRQDLETQLQNIDNDLKRCNLLKIQLNQIIDDTAKKRLDSLKKQLLSRELSFWQATKKLPKIKDISGQEYQAILPLFDKTYKIVSWPLLFLIIVGLGLGFFWRRQGQHSPINNKNYSSPTLISITRGIKRTSPILFSLVLSFAYLQPQLSSDSILIQSFKFALILCFAFAFIRGALFPEKPFFSTSKLSKRTILTLVWSTIIFSTISYALNDGSLGRFSNSVILYIVWLVSLSLSALSLMGILWLSINNFLVKKSFTPSFFIPIAMLGIAIIAAFFGYRNFSSLLYFGTLMSLIIIVFAYLALRVSSEFFDSLDQGKIAWQYKLRMAMMISESSAFPGVVWLRILFFFAIAFASISALMYVWGSSQQRITTLLNSLQSGFTIGSVNLDLLSIVYALVTLIVTLSLLPFIKNQLVSSWLKHSNLSRGAKEATQTLVGYVGILVAVLWALSILGVNFQNIAIIAGALSVGIGFGLQNIVNNFVSGLILLFERPIRRGDWVEVGNTEGYVREISIRSTRIETFDRADVIVPNSELISNQVTNWMLSSNIGRLKSAVGVAYGSDVSKVMEVLKQIANNHSEVISDHPNYAISVLFLSFGDSSLNFELRCFVKNVDNRLNILSDINQEIDREFRKENIEIPFPQRVVHIDNNNTP